MKTRKFVLMVLAAIFLIPCLVSAQPDKGKNLPEYENSIPLDGISGRIDHMAYDSTRQLLFVAALGNNSVEIVDLKTNKVIHSIKDLDEPQGIAFIPGSKALIVANGGNGVCDVFDTETFEKITSLKLEGDADNVRYNPSDQKIYIGFGDGGIAIVDASTFHLITKVGVDAHPESFQLDKLSGKIYVNVPDKEQIEVIDQAGNSIVQKWKLTEAKSNYPMALDEKSHRLFIGCRHPSKLLIINAETGKTLSSPDIHGDVDDIFYDHRTGQFFCSCGEGYLDVFKENPDGSFVSAGNVVTEGGARTSLLIPDLNRLFLAVPHSPGKEAHLLVYRVRL